MAKLPWYMKGTITKDGLNIRFHWLWVLWQKLKIVVKLLFRRIR